MSYDSMNLALFGRFSATDEIQRLIEGFSFMSKNLPWTDFVQPISASAMTYGQQQAEQIQSMLTYMASTSESTCKPMKFTELEKVKAKKSGVRKVRRIPITVYNTQ